MKQVFAIGNFTKLGRAYNVTAQTMSNLHRRHGVVITDPDELFQSLVASGRQSRLRTRLSDPAERQRITAAIFSNA